MIKIKSIFIPVLYVVCGQQNPVEWTGDVVTGGILLKSAEICLVAALVAARSMRRSCVNIVQNDHSFQIISMTVIFQ